MDMASMLGAAPIQTVSFLSASGGLVLLASRHPDSVRADAA